MGGKALKIKIVKILKMTKKNIDDLLRNARYLEHQNFERRFQGDNFEKKSTRLQLNYIFIG